MGKRTKQKRLDAVHGCENVYHANLQNAQEWSKFFFEENDAPLILELGCGKGDYTLGLARLFPKKNFLGVDVKGERVWRGATQALKEDLHNVRFLCGRVEWLLDYLKPQSVSEIWITFPDPFVKSRQEKHRLTASGFLQQYQKLLLPGGLLHVKTDNEDFFEYSIAAIEAFGGKVLRSIAHIYHTSKVDPILAIQTDFERKHLARGRKIFYLCANLTNMKK